MILIKGLDISQLLRASHSVSGGGEPNTAEQWIENPRVGGSIPPPGTI